MGKQASDLSKIKGTAIFFLYFDIEETEISPIVIQHPIFESAFRMLTEDNTSSMVNILDDKEAYSKVCKQFKRIINNAKSVDNVFCYIRKPYRLVFLRYIRHYLSDRDFTKLFRQAWITSENPNTDVNVGLETLINWYKESKKDLLMNREEYLKFLSLPDNLTVYRGVGTKSNPKGLSWSLGIDKARWFAYRFGSYGAIQEAEITKDKILAYFESRGEEEIIVDTTDIIYRVIEEAERGRRLDV